jgi:hypothetical protein
MLLQRLISVAGRACLLAAPTVAQEGGPAAARPDSSAFLSIQRDGGGYGLVPDEATLREQVKEPLFAFVFSLVEADSVGAWTADDLLAFADRWGEDSAFPVAEHLRSIRRERLAGEAVIEHRGARCTRRWVVVLTPAPVSFPLPFSILGYHPGSLSIQTPLVLNEWQLGERSVFVTVEGATRRYDATAITVWEVASGWLILDVDGWLDKLLGKAADDAATKGFTACWMEGELVGVGVSVGRDGRSIYGELDFRSGEIENHGRPVARGIAHYTRGWTRIQDPDAEGTWRAYEER